jgi:hypothetical protein
MYFAGAGTNFGGGGNSECVAVIEILSGSFMGNEFCDGLLADAGGNAFLVAARVASKWRVTFTVLPEGNFAAHAAISADGSPVAALNSAIVLSGRTPSFTVWFVICILVAVGIVGDLLLAVMLEGTPNKPYGMLPIVVVPEHGNNEAKFKFLMLEVDKLAEERWSLSLLVESDTG